jgi:hypothetical protein
MKGYHLYFYILKFLILLMIALISLKIIVIKNKFILLMDSIFKISFGLFIIIFFTKNINHSLEKNDRMIIILSGFILILLVDYIGLINFILNKDNTINNIDNIESYTN